MSIRVFITVFFSVTFCFMRPALAGEPLQAPAAIQISSSISEGKYSLNEIVELAKNNNIKVVVITDFYLARLEYGIYPLRNLIKKTVEFNSVFKYGIKNYLNQIKKLQKNNPDMILIPAVETAPFYYWQGNIFNNDLRIVNWHKHILVLGLGKPSDYERLPVLGNTRGLIMRFTPGDILKLWPVMLLLIGILFLSKRKFNYKSLYGTKLGPYSKPCQAIGVLLIISGIIFLYNNLPFCEFKLNQYQGDLGISPYQNLIDFVNQNGGLTFWAHPEAENIDRIDNLKIETGNYIGDLGLAKDYTGFAVFYEGYKKIGCVGCLWDEILKDYCRGVRKSPVWVIGALAFERSGDLAQAFGDLRTVLLIKNFNQTEVQNSLKRGKMYVVRGKDSSRFILEDFSAKDIHRGTSKSIGQELSSSGEVSIKIKASFLNGQSKPFTIKLIRDGAVVKIFDCDSPLDLDYYDDNTSYRGMRYYRLQIESSDLIVITNPIFVRFISKDK